MFALSGILRAESQEKILIYLLIRESGYGKGISDFFGISQNAVQKQLVRLEEDGVVVGRQIGTVREFQLNPRYPFLKPLKELVKTAVAIYPKDVIQKLGITRTRPRKSGKPLITART